MRSPLLSESFEPRQTRSHAPRGDTPCDAPRLFVRMERRVVAVLVGFDRSHELRGFSYLTCFTALAFTGHGGPERDIRHYHVEHGSERPEWPSR
jgi:hypothetical protein